MEKIIDKKIFLSKDEIKFLVKYFSGNGNSGGYIFYYVCSVLFFAAGAFFAFVAENVNLIIPILMFVLAIFSLLQPLLFIPLRIEKSAEKIYAKQRMTNVIIGEGRVIDVPVIGQEPPYTEINIPISRLAGVDQTEDFIILKVDAIKTVIIPKRELSPEETEKVLLALGL